MKYLFIIVMALSPVWADDLSYKDRSNEGENKYERIGKLEDYLSKLSSKLTKKHSDMKAEFKKDLLALEVKLRKERDSELENSVKKIDKRMTEVSSKGSDYAQKKYAEETRGQLTTLKSRIIELLSKVEVLELKMEDIDSRR